MARAGLSREVVVAQAAAIADEIGFEHLTLAEVAERLGVKLPSLYKHITSLDGLRRDLAVAATRELADTLAEATVGRAGTDALRAAADAYRSFAVAHPGRYAATVRAPGPDDAEHTAVSDAVLRVVFAVLSGYGLAGDDAIDAARALRAAMHGFVTLESGGGFAMPRDLERSYHRLIEGLDQVLRGWAIPAGGRELRRAPGKAPRRRHPAA